MMRPVSAMQEDRGDGGRDAGEGSDKTFEK